MQNDDFDFRRAAFGVISFSFVLIGIVAYVANWESVAYWVMLRSGLFMSAVWLALPDLTSTRSRLSTPSLVLSVVLIVVLAIRPRIFMVLGSLAIVAFLLQGVVRRFTKGLKK